MNPTQGLMAVTLKAVTMPLAGTNVRHRDVASLIKQSVSPDTSPLPAIQPSRGLDCTPATASLPPSTPDRHGDMILVDGCGKVGLVWGKVPDHPCWGAPARIESHLILLAGAWLPGRFDAP